MNDDQLVWLIGAGGMAMDYLAVLKALSVKTKVIGRGEDSASNFKSKTGITVVRDSLKNLASIDGGVPKFAIVAVGVEDLFDVTRQLIQLGVKNVLVEKPGAMNLVDLNILKDLAEKYEAIISIGYNRRFYGSVREALRIIEKDGGLVSMSFDFTEWSHVIENLEKPNLVKEKWLIGNSTHVLDLAFFIGGVPSEWSHYSQGSLDWHSSSSVFSGAGVTDKKVVFSYHANWESAGRWGIELLTNSNKLILSPLEELSVMKKGTINLETLTVENEGLDKKFKPGLFSETKSFLDKEEGTLCTLDEHISAWKIYSMIAGYNE